MDASTKAGLIFRLTSVFTRLPWPVLRLLADGLAGLWQRLNARESRVARRNLELVFPELDAAAR